MMHGLDRRLRKLESVLPPLLTPHVSWTMGLLWFAVAFYLGNPSPGEKPFAAYARALGYANEAELESAMEAKNRELARNISNILGVPTADNDKPAYARAPRYTGSERNRATVDRARDLSIKVYRAENEVMAKFGIFVSSLDEHDDASKARFWENQKRMYAGLPRSYKKQLKMVLTRVNNLAWMRIYYSDNLGPYLRCFA